MLLVLDPAVPCDALRRALEANDRWCRLVKRSLPTLSRNEYQLVVVLPGVMGEHEREASKLVSPTLQLWTGSDAPS